MLIIKNLKYIYEEQTMRLDQNQIALELADLQVKEFRRTCPDIMQMVLSVGQSYFDDACHKQIEVRMPRVSFTTREDMYLDQQAMCEIVAADYKNWAQITTNYFDRLDKGKPLIE